MIQYLLDTCICIEMIRGRGGPMIVSLASLPDGSVGISAITLAELRYGVARSNDPERNALALREFCAPLTVAPFDEQAAAVYGRVRCALAAVGRPIGPMDTLIAAHALALSAVLITANVSEFRRVPGLEVENWMASP